jgi:hypothetical protein
VASSAFDIAMLRSSVWKTIRNLISVVACGDQDASIWVPKQSFTVIDSASETNWVPPLRHSERSGD